MAVQFGRGGGRAGSAGRGGGAGRGAGTGSGRGRMGGPYKAGPGGDCICPACGHKEPHSAGDPCFGKACPKCGTKMVRE